MTPAADREALYLRLYGAWPEWTWPFTLFEGRSYANRLRGSDALADLLRAGRIEFRDRECRVRMGLA